MCDVQSSLLTILKIDNSSISVSSQTPNCRMLRLKSHTELISHFTILHRGRYTCSKHTVLSTCYCTVLRLLLSGKALKKEKKENHPHPIIVPHLSFFFHKKDRNHPKVCYYYLLYLNDYSMKLLSLIHI